MDLLKSQTEIGNWVHKGQLIAVVEDQMIFARFDGLLRGLLHDGLRVHRGLKVGDIDARQNPRFATHVSEKSQAIGGGLLETLLTYSEIRRCLWN